MFINAVGVVFSSWECLDVGVDFCFLFFFSGDGCEAGYGLLSLYEDSFMIGISLNCVSRWFWLIFVWLKIMVR